MVADARARVEAARAKGIAVPEADARRPPARSPAVAEEGAKPLDERYVDDGSVTADDRKKFSLRSGATSTALPTVGGAVPGERMSDAEVMGEIGGKKRIVIIAIAAVVVALLGIVVVKKLHREGRLEERRGADADDDPDDAPAASAGAAAADAAPPPEPQPKPRPRPPRDGDEPAPKAAHARRRREEARRRQEGQGQEGPQVVRPWRVPTARDELRRRPRCARRVAV